MSRSFLGAIITKEFNTSPIFLISPATRVIASEVLRVTPLKTLPGLSASAKILCKLSLLAGSLRKLANSSNLPAHSSTFLIFSLEMLGEVPSISNWSLGVSASKDCSKASLSCSGENSSTAFTSTFSSASFIKIE